MVISYEPDKTPQLSQEMIDEAEKMNAKLVAVACEEGGDPAERTGVSFWALTDFLPRPGDMLRGTEGTIYVVDKIVFRIVEDHRSDGTARSISLVPNIHAVMRKA